MEKSKGDFMIILDNVIGCQTISLKTARLVGTVKNIILENFKIKGLVVFNDDSNDFFVPLSNVHEFGENITIKNEPIDMEEPESKKLLGSSIVTHSGDKVGVALDMLFCSRYKKLISVKTETREILTSEIQTIGTNVIVLKGKAKLPSPSRTKSIKKKKVAKKEIKVTQKTCKSAPREVINMSIFNNSGIYAFLLGRKATHNITSKSGQLEIKAGELITPEHIKTSMLSGTIKNLLTSSVV